MESRYSKCQKIIEDSQRQLDELRRIKADAEVNMVSAKKHEKEAEKAYFENETLENKMELKRWIEIECKWEDAIRDAQREIEQVHETMERAMKLQEEDKAAYSVDSPVVSVKPSIPVGASMPDRKSTRHSVSITLFCVAALFIISGFIESSNLVLLITISLSLLVAGLIVYSKETTSDLYEIQKTFQCISTRAAGVTFENSDGRSRQGILERASAAAGMANKCYVTAQLRHYLYKDEDAFAIETAYGCIGNIPADTVFRIVDAFNDIKTVLVYPKNFVNENGRTVWFADVEVYY